MNIEISGIEYKITKLSVIDQHFLASALAPFLPLVATGYAAFFSADSAEKPEGEGVTDKQITQLADATRPLFNAIAELPAERNLAILSRLLGSVTRNSGGRFSAVWSKDAGNFMFQDIELLDVYKLCAASFKVNLGDFLAAAITSA